MPLGIQREWLQLQGQFVDLAKFVVGTARLYEEAYLRDKLALYEEHQVSPFLGGQFMEFVLATQGFSGVTPYCEEASRLGFKALEVSDNVVTMNSQTRRDVICAAVDCGLQVHGEVGSKSEDSGAQKLIDEAHECYEAGAEVVLVEGAELVLPGGAPHQALIEGLRDGLDPAKVIFELSGTWIRDTRQTDVYQLKMFLVRTFGADVNLANVMPEHVFETEALRVGLSVPGPSA